MSSSGKTLKTLQKYVPGAEVSIDSMKTRETKVLTERDRKPGMFTMTTYKKSSPYGFLESWLSSSVILRRGRVFRVSRLTLIDIDGLGKKPA